jgi:hypothetical protein
VNCPGKSFKKFASYFPGSRISEEGEVQLDSIFYSEERGKIPETFSFSFTIFLTPPLNHIKSYLKGNYQVFMHTR